MDLNDAGKRFRFLMRDRDAKVTAMFDAVLTGAGVQVLNTWRTPSASDSWAASAAVEHYVGEVRVDSSTGASPSTNAAQSRPWPSTQDLWVPEIRPPTVTCGFVTHPGSA
jgi:hypothetical protein